MQTTKLRTAEMIFIKILIAVFLLVPSAAYVHAAPIDAQSAQLQVSLAHAPVYDTTTRQLSIAAEVNNQASSEVTGLQAVVAIKRSHFQDIPSSNASNMIGAGGMTINGKPHSAPLVSLAVISQTTQAIPRIAGKSVSLIQATIVLPRTIDTGYYFVSVSVFNLAGVTVGYVLQPLTQQLAGDDTFLSIPLEHAFVKDANDQLQVAGFSPQLAVGKAVSIQFTVHNPHTTAISAVPYWIIHQVRTEKQGEVSGKDVEITVEAGQDRTVTLELPASHSAQKYLVDLVMKSTKTQEAQSNFIGFAFTATGPALSLLSQKSQINRTDRQTSLTLQNVAAGTGDNQAPFMATVITKVIETKHGNVLGQSTVQQQIQPKTTNQFTSSVNYVSLLHPETSVMIETTFYDSAGNLLDSSSKSLTLNAVSGIIPILIITLLLIGALISLLIWKKRHISLLKPAVLALIFLMVAGTGQAKAFNYKGTNFPNITSTTEGPLVNQTDPYTAFLQQYDSGTARMSWPSQPNPTTATFFALPEIFAYGTFMSNKGINNITGYEIIKDMPAYTAHIEVTGDIADCTANKAYAKSLYGTSAISAAPELSAAYVSNNKIVQPPYPYAFGIIDAQANQDSMIVCGQKGSMSMKVTMYTSTYQDIGALYPGLPNSQYYTNNPYILFSCIEKNMVSPYPISNVDGSQSLNSASNCGLYKENLANVIGQCARNFYFTDASPPLRLSGDQPSGNTLCVDIIKPQPTVTLTLAKNPVFVNDPYTLSWKTTDADTITIDGVPQTLDNTGSGSLTGTASSIQGIQTFRATVKNKQGTGNYSLDLTVKSHPLPTVVLKLVPDTVFVGDSYTLSWKTTDATSIKINGVNKSLDANGSGFIKDKAVNPLGQQEFAATAFNNYGPSGVFSIKLLVKPLPTLTLTVSAIGGTAGPSTSVYVGDSYTVGWTTTNASSFTLDNTPETQVASGTSLGTAPSTPQTVIITGQACEPLGSGQGCVTETATVTASAVAVTAAKIAHFCLGD